MNAGNDSTDEYELQKNWVFVYGGGHLGYGRQLCSTPDDVTEGGYQLLIPLENHTDRGGMPKVSDCDHLCQTISPETSIILKPESPLKQSIFP